MRYPTSFFYSQNYTTACEQLFTEMSLHSLECHRGRKQNLLEATPLKTNFDFNKVSDLSQFTQTETQI